LVLRCSLSIVIGAIAVFGNSAAAQDSQGIGITFQFVGSSQIGVTVPLSRSVSLRPSLQAFWRQSEVITGLGTSHPKDAQVALALDCLFDIRAASPVTAYLGLGGSIDQIDAADADFAAAWREIAGQHLHRRRFAGPVGTQQAEHFSAPEFE
jgi:hypothetical protein